MNDLQSPPAPQRLSISIVIPAFNEEKTIERCLNGILWQQDHAIDFEIWVVDDHSNDATTSVVQRIKQQHLEIQVNLIRNNENLGRFKTRLKGIMKCRHDLILLIDSKVALAPTAFNAIQHIGYHPLIGTNCINPPQSLSIIEHAYLLIRRRVYRGNYPKMEHSSIQIYPENFDFYPKGTTVFLCEKSLLLNSLPERMGHHASDDTAWLRNIAARRSLMLHNDFEFSYMPRTSLTAALIHLFQRGPKFADYYYQPGKRFFALINTVAALTLAAFFLTLTTPKAANWIFCILAVALMTCAGYLARKPSDFLRLLLSLPLLAAIFGSGLVYGIFLKLKDFSICRENR